MFWVSNIALGCRPARLASASNECRRTIGRPISPAGLSLYASPDRLVFRFRLGLGVGVDERREVVAFRPLDIVQDDVVLFRAFVFEQTQIRLGPLDPVGALRVGHDQAVARGVGVGSGDLPGVVVHPIFVTVLKNGCVSAPVAFPRLVERDCHLLPNRLVHLERDVRHRVDEIIVDEQLAAVAKGDRLVGLSRCLSRRIEIAAQRTRQRVMAGLRKGAGGVEGGEMCYFPDCNGGTSGGVEGSGDLGLGTGVKRGIRV